MPFDNERFPKDEEYCKSCGMLKSQKTIVRPVHDGPWPLSGKGHIDKELATWCPNCDIEPASPGPPIRDPEGWMRRMIGQD